MILEKIQRIPNDGEKFEIEAFGMKIKVEKVEARKIEEVIITYDTISGLILEKIQRIPNDGEKFEIEAFGMKIKVEKVEARKIEEVIITIV